MNSIFAEVLRKFVLLFFDDILIYSPDWHSYLTHLMHVLNILGDNVLCAKLSKCSFGQIRVDYLSHMVSRKGVRVDDPKIQTIK